MFNTTQAAASCTALTVLHWTRHSSDCCGDEVITTTITARRHGCMGTTEHLCLRILHLFCETPLQQKAEL